MNRFNTNGKIYIENGVVYRPDEEGFVSIPGSEKPASISKQDLLSRALELELGESAVLELLTAEELTALIAENTDETAGDDKSALIEKALALKESNPKAVKASPSAIPSMSVNKLTALIAEAEAIIAGKA